MQLAKILHAYKDRIDIEDSQSNKEPSEAVLNNDSKK
jgi:hypothetical protein